MKRFIPYAIVAGVVLVLIIVAIVLSAIFNWLLNLLYIFLILLAVLMLTATGLQVFSIFLLIRTIFMVRDEMKPLLQSVQETLGIVKDTAKTAGHTVSTIGTATQLTSEFAVGPGVKAAAAVLAGQQMFRVFLGKGKVRSRADQRRKQQQDALAGAGGE
jgi:hypothetical protein